MRASDWKLIEDLREKIYGLIDSNPTSALLGVASCKFKALRVF